MMRIMGMNGLGKDVVDAVVTQLLVRDANGSPVAVFVEHGGSIIMSVLGDDDFDRVIANMGLTVTVVPVSAGS